MGLAWQASTTSLQTPVLQASVKIEQSLSPPPVHTPDWQVSPTLQKSPSLHGELFGSAAKQLAFASLQLSAQLPSPSAPGQGLPACWMHAPVTQVSAPLQNVPSLHGVPD